MNQGFAAQHEGDLDAALANFQEAHAMNPSARTLNAIATVEFDRGHFDVAYVRGSEALASTSSERPLTPERRRALVELVRRARAHLAFFSLANLPTGFVIEVDDGPPDLENGALVLMEGSHSLQIRAPGHERLSRSLRVEAGQSGPLPVELEPIRVAPPVATPAVTPPPVVVITPTQSAPTPARARDDGFDWTPLAGIATGLGVVGLTTGVVSHVLAEERATVFNRPQAETGCAGDATFSNCQTVLNEYNAERTVEMIGFVVGGVAAAGAVVFWVLDATSGSSTSAQSSNGCVPTVLGARCSF